MESKGSDGNLEREVVPIQCLGEDIDLPTQASTQASTQLSLREIQEQLIAKQQTDRSTLQVAKQMTDRSTLPTAEQETDRSTTSNERLVHKGHQLGNSESMSSCGTTDQQSDLYDSGIEIVRETQTESLSKSDQQSDLYDYGIEKVRDTQTESLSKSMDHDDLNTGAQQSQAQMTLSTPDETILQSEKQETDKELGHTKLKQIIASVVIHLSHNM